MNFLATNLVARHVAETAARIAGNNPLVRTGAGAIAARWALRSVVERSGDHVGTLEDILLEDSTNRIAYHVVHPAHSHAGQDFVGVRPDLVSANPENVTIACSLGECQSLPEHHWPLSIDEAAAEDGEDGCGETLPMAR